MELVTVLFAMPSKYVGKLPILFRGHDENCQLLFRMAQHVYEEYIQLKRLLLLSYVYKLLYLAY